MKIKCKPLLKPENVILKIMIVFLSDTPYNETITYNPLFQMNYSPFSFGKTNCFFFEAVLFLYKKSIQV